MPRPLHAGWPSSCLVGDLAVHSVVKLLGGLVQMLSDRVIKLLGGT